MKQTTDMSKTMIYKIFDMLDFDGSGRIDFNEFYVIICIIVAVKVSSCTLLSQFLSRERLVILVVFFQDNLEKQFIYSHSRTVFDFLNEDSSNAVSVEEFINFGFLFNFREDAIRGIFREFDLSGDQVRLRM